MGSVQTKKRRKPRGRSSVGCSNASRRRKTIPERPPAVDDHESRKTGYENGYQDGLQVGIQTYNHGFEGTSIIIPTYNQADYLKKCVNSIMDNTDLPYEIIVVDNASTDGTAAYLEKFAGQVRYRILDSNLGFAGAVNVGLMMAKGRTLLLLNNDTLMTKNSLHNMLACLHSDENIGMVGPVTNYIGGEQKIKVPYTNVRQMPAFAKKHNVPNRSKWRRTNRLVGFCLLFRRELFEQVGYFDEGFEVGNFEDDDFNIRVRMLGRSLMIAGDAFIHHFGSVSMKALGDRIDQINEHNGQYFSDKWHQAGEWTTGRSAPGAQGSVAFFPDHICVQGIGAGVYWIDAGKRRLVDGAVTCPLVRLSQVDLKQCPLGEAVSAEEVERIWQSENGELTRTVVLALPDGLRYYLQENRVRRIIGSTAMQTWNLQFKPHMTIHPELLKEWAEGPPIITPPTLRQVL